MGLDTPSFETNGFEAVALGPEASGRQAIFCLKASEISGTPDPCFTSTG